MLQLLPFNIGYFSIIYVDIYAKRFVFTEFLEERWLLERREQLKKNHPRSILNRHSNSLILNSGNQQNLAIFSPWLLIMIGISCDRVDLLTYQ